jgi:hypothetical protein
MAYESSFTGLLYCQDCCVALEPWIQFEAVSAQAVKHGFDGFISSSPPKRFLQKSFSGGLEQLTSPYGSVTGSPPFCENWSGWTSWVVGGSAIYDLAGNCTSTLYGHHSASYGSDWTNNYDCGEHIGYEVIMSETQVRSDTTQGCIVSRFSTTLQTGNSYETLSNEYTTDMLWEYAASQMPAFSGVYELYGHNSVLAIRDIDSNEHSVALTKARYRIMFPARVRAVTWLERFVPASGAGLTGISITRIGQNLAMAEVSVPYGSGGGYGSIFFAMLSAGAVSSVAVSAQGSGYTSPPTINMPQPRDGGARATAVAIMGVGHVYVTAYGGVYEAKPDVVISGGGGSGAAAEVILSASGHVLSINLTDSGFGYTSRPTVTIIGGKATAEAYLCVIAANVTSPGSGYDCVLDIDVNSQYQKSATGSIIVDGDPSSESFGQILSVTLTNPGEAYKETPSVSVVGPWGVNTAGWGFVVELGTSVERRHDHDGSAPEGYDQNIWDTWPKTADFDVEPPIDLGIVEVTDIRMIL